MDLEAFLESWSEKLVAEATESLQRAHLEHYEAAGRAVAEQRLRRLYAVMTQAVARRDASAMTAYAQEMARERFDAGFDLREVQTAFNVLEEVVWRAVLADLPPTSAAEAMGLVTTALGLGKDALAREYVTLAGHHAAPSLDVSALFAGTVGHYA